MIPLVLFLLVFPLEDFLPDCSISENLRKLFSADIINLYTKFIHS